MRKIEYLFIIFFALIINLYPQRNTSEIQIRTIRATEKITIDGKLLENIWNRKGFSGLEQQDPDQGKAPSQKSLIWVAYDDDAFYFAGKFYDTAPDSIMSRLVRRDFIWGDPSDGCVIYLDPFRDKRNGYFFYVSAAGTLADGLIQNDEKQPNDLTWDAVWEGVHYLDTDGWSVEMKIPFSQLRFNDVEKQVWGFNAERFISRRFETDMIAYTPRNESGFASRFPDPTEYFRNAGLNASTYLSYDFGGNKTAQGYRLEGWLNFHDFSGTNFSAYYYPSSLNARRTIGGPLTFNPVRP